MGRTAAPFHTADSFLETPIHLALAFKFALDSFALRLFGFAPRSLGVAPRPLGVALRAG